MYGHEAVFGVVSSSFGVGAVVAAVVGSRWSPRRPMLAATLCAVLWPLAIVGYAGGLPLWLVYLLGVLSGGGIGLFAVWWETALAQRIPPHLLSRVAAWDLMGSLALLPLGYVLAGPVSARVGSVHLLVIGGFAACGVTVLGLLPSSTRSLTRLEPA